MDEEVVDTGTETEAPESFVEDLPDDKLSELLAQPGDVSDDTAVEDAPTAEQEAEPAIEEPTQPEPEAAPAVDPLQELERKFTERFDQQERFIQQLKSENGELRKGITPQPAPPDFYENPQEAVNYEVQRVLGEINAQTEYRQNEIAAIKGQTLHYMPDFNDHINEMAEMVKADGGDPDAFKANPYDYAGNAVTLVNLARYVKAGKEAAALKAEIEALKKKPDEMLKQIDAASRAKPGVTASSGQSAAVPRTVESPIDAAKLTDKQLQEHIAMLADSA